ncbi:acetyl/propionyl/methylcrotonyl-CoA carboxylase subunit alpha [Mycolicibacterium fallax]|uniref:biotin carboxylase n=1 Tax=Mycolicibacterium fallax TaxID=1793 RepID=A0A1X1R590_MYCFA|nr:biotin carboxylase N-terminal domain-containing protein [Mycolicibacterium fallax]ORU99829.1 acetyl/propionyl-CoA carboxylase subuit alpha [Mycolicibacterium fallax]BBZ00203.1 acetyl/propionyl-CoA carboxylase subuit alpha [Mycolicibacterium fallax]
MISKVLVANRGEIARRVFRTCRRLGLGTVAVYTDPDTGAPHVAEADTRVRLDDIRGYLDVDALIEAARASGADAIHPGYGFLSENADFANAVTAAGLAWIGPPAAAVTAMGSKIEAKKMMAAAGVPVLAELDPATVTADQLPVLVKASAGGGGRGMRVVTELGALAEEVAAAGREAASAFGDPTVFCERYLPTGHHVEVQVLADTHGTVWAVGERECSIQRRHQKVIEEAPSPLVERIDGMRERLFQAARLAAEAIGYTGAGTVEFLADDDGEFFFLEMNTRLQVEHPVTEATTGLDLVELQIQVADGERLPSQPPAARGHSIEARLYAEDPAQHWQPQAGTVEHFEVPAAATEFHSTGRTEIRLDSGIVTGSAVSIHYDPMLAKVISYAPTRRTAALLLADALARTRLHGVRTNRDLLVNVLRHRGFLAGDTDTAFFDSHGLPALAAPLLDEAAVRLAAVAAAIAETEHNRAVATALPGIRSGWRNVVSADQHKTFRLAGPEQTEYRVGYRYTRTAIALPDDEGVRVVAAGPDRVVLAVDAGAAAAETAFDVRRHGDAVFVDSPTGGVEFAVVPRFVEPGSQLAAGSLVAPMPGVVIRIAAEAGDAVTAGQPLLWLEAMKMEHTLTAPNDGVLKELNVIAGQQVDVGTVLAVVSEPDN